MIMKTIIERLKSLQRWDNEAHDWDLSNVVECADGDWVEWKDIQAIIEKLERIFSENTKGSFDVGGYFYPKGGIQPLHNDVWKEEEK